jgi:hypothetical protein
MLAVGTSVPVQPPQPMVLSTPTPSPRLLRAAAAERDELDRHRDRLLTARERLQAELAAVERSLQEVDERRHLLDRLTAVADDDGGRGRAAGERVDESARAGTGGRAPERRVVAPAPDPGHVASGAAATAAPPTSAGRGTQHTTLPSAAAGRTRAAPPADVPQQVLRGPAIRRAAVDVLLARPDRPEALHYREWFALLRRAGFEVAGKDPLAVFLTQLSRSPVVRKGTQAGVYELDLGAPARLGMRLDRLHDELRALTARPEATADLAAIRAQREQLTVEISQTEKALEEAEATLAAAPPATVAAAAG